MVSFGVGSVLRSHSAVDSAVDSAVASSGVGLNFCFFAGGYKVLQYCMILLLQQSEMIHINNTSPNRYLITRTL